MAPWVNIHVGTLERLKPCCAGAGINHSLEQLPEYFSNINQDLVRIKKQFRDQLVPSACEGCQEHHWYSQFIDQAPTGIDDFTLLSLDLRWANTCQLTCTYCSPTQSSAWASLQNQSNMIPIIGRRIRDKASLIDLIQHHRSTIQRVSLLGGEPLLIKENLKVLDLLPADIEVNIFTGLNVDLDTNAIYQRLIDMSNVYWTVSMENIGKKFEFVRRNASWSKQVENIDHLLSQNKSQYTVNFQSQFCAYSATSITELYDFVADRDINITWHWLTNPTPLDFVNFPDRYKFQSLKQLKDLKEQGHTMKYLPQVDDLITKLENTLTLGHDRHVDNCIQWHKDQEARYFHNSMDFQTLWPEFSE